MAAVFAAALLSCGAASDGAGDGDWPMYRGDAAGTGYSPLDELNAANVAGLAQAWSYSLARRRWPVMTEPSSRGPPAPRRRRSSWTA